MPPDSQGVVALALKHLGPTAAALVVLSAGIGLGAGAAGTYLVLTATAAVAAPAEREPEDAKWRLGVDGKLERIQRQVDRMAGALETRGLIPPGSTP